jgi:hypothetical protein
MTTSSAAASPTRASFDGIASFARAIRGAVSKKTIAAGGAEDWFERVEGGAHRVACDKADDVALDVLRRAVRDKHDAARAEVLGWVTGVEDRCAKNEPFTVLEHTAMTYLLSCKFFAGEASEDPLERQARSALEKGLSSSWKHLTGRDRPKDQLLERLPKSVLVHATRRARIYHAAAFLPIGDRKAQQAASRLLRDFVPEPQDAVIVTAALLAGAFSTVACQVLAAAILSYGVIGLSESFQHNHLAHPRPGTVGGWILDGPKPDASFIERGLHRAIAWAMRDKIEFAKLSHQIVHHHRTFTDSYTRMFESPEAKAKVDAFVHKWAEQTAQKIVLERYGASPTPKEKKKADAFVQKYIEETKKMIKAEHYGSTLTPKGILQVIAAIGPQTAALIAGAFLLGASPWAYVPIVLIAAVFPFTMAKVHPFMHNDEHESRADAGPLMKMILNSRWAAWACRNHWLHHNGEVDYNLSFPGADALLGTLLQPNLDDLFQMADEGTLHY